MDKKRILEILERAKDDNGEIPMSLVRKAFEKIEEPQWIPCSERLPEDEYVLISKKPTMLSGSKWCVAIAIRMADPRSRKVKWMDIGFGKIPDDKVLAWMPLPEPYKAERRMEVEECPDKDKSLLQSPITT